MNSNRLIAALAIGSLSATASAASSGELATQRAAEIVSVMQGDGKPAETFDERFLAEVPPEKLAALVQQLEAANGKVLRADRIHLETASTATFRIRFERATAVGRMTLGGAAPYKVGGFWIGSVVPIGDDAAKIASDLAALPGRTGFLVTKLGDAAPIASAHADAQFAIGSAFKLWVLDALAAEIEAGRLHWDQVVHLGPRSLPSGITQDWPPDAAVTIETLATLMISRSDNTATDTLIRLIGRERIGERLRAGGHSDPARMLPLLTTAEVFALKLGPAATREAYVKADEAGQARMLDGLDTRKILAGADLAALDGRPIAIDEIEWFASPHDIVGVLDRLRRHQDTRVLRILGVAPSLPAGLQERFAYAGYKGGSEPGVLNMTWLLRDQAGIWIAVVANWNDPDNAVDHADLEPFVSRLFGLIP
jgi:beta-lactamase class A